jgi:hypothetical protein
VASAIKLQGEKIMRGIKSIVVIATLIATAAALGACRREEPALKLGAGADLPVSESTR